MLIHVVFGIGFLSGENSIIYIAPIRANALVVKFCTEINAKPAIRRVNKITSELRCRGTQVASKMTWQKSSRTQDSQPKLCIKNINEG